MCPLPSLASVLELRFRFWYACCSLSASISTASVATKTPARTKSARPNGGDACDGECGDESVRSRNCGSSTAKRR